MGNRDTRIGGGEVGVEVYGAISDLTKTVKNALLSEGGGVGILIDQPSVDTSFTPIYEVEGDDIYVTLKYFIPGFTQELTVHIVDSTQIVDEPSYNKKRKKEIIQDISDADRQAQELERRFDRPLRAERLHHVIYLRAWDENENPHDNPEGGTDFSGYPGNVLFSFTTPAALTTPLNKPHIGNIIENNLDDGTTRQFDVWLSVQIIAPASASGAATGTVTVTKDSVTVNGSGTAFLTDFPVGSAIEVNNETHIVATTPSNILLTVDYAFRQATASGQAATKKTLYTFGSANIVAVTPKFRATTDSEVKALSPHTAIDEVTALLTNIRVKVPGFFAGKTYNYVSNLATGEGSARILSTPSTTQTFTAGNFTTPTANIPEWTTAPFFQYDATDPQNDNRRDVSLRIVETNPPIAKDKVILYRRNAGTGTVSASTTTLTGVGTDFLTSIAKGHFIIAAGQTLEVQSVTNDTSLVLVAAPSPSISGATWVKSVLKSDHNLQIGKFHPSAGGLIPRIKFGEIKTKKLTAFDFVAEIYALNGVTRSITDTFTTDGSGEVPTDTDRPSTPSAPICQPFIDGNVKVEAEVPTTQFNTIKKYRFAMSTSNTAPDRDSPSVGVATVVALKKGALFVMFQRALIDISSITFYFRVQALNVIGWSEWSAATSVLGSDIGRPLTDVIGNGVADHSMGLLSSGTGAASPANTTTTYNISTGDSTNYQALLSAGTIIHLHIPSLDPDDVIRKATSFDDANNRFTVDVAFGSTPGNSLPYEIHYGNTLGEKSGTGHSTTVIDLGVAGAALANDTLLGYYIYMPSLGATDEIRRITDHTGGNVTLESATAGTLGNNDCYLICQGSFGYAAINPLSGIIAAVPFRIYLDDETGQNRFDVVMPSGENVFSARAVEFRGYRKSNGVLRTIDPFDVSVIPSYPISAPSGYTPVFTMRIQNMFREGSDGWNNETFYLEGFRSTDTPPTTYDPSVIPTVEGDIFSRDNYPSSEYPTY